MKKIIVAIDGYAGAGKSTTAKQVAQHLSYTYVDSGAMYRAVTLYFLQEGVDWENADRVKEALRHIHVDFVFNTQTQKGETRLNEENVESEIRKMYISERVSDVSKIAAVRKTVGEQQQRMGKQKGIVMDGRDIGTRVFPEAELKIFMTADIQVRAMRRQFELHEKGEILALDEILENLRQRDHIDTTRQESPLKQAEDAILLNSTDLTVEEQVQFVLEKAQSLIHAG